MSLNQDQFRHIVANQSVVKRRTLWALLACFPLSTSPSLFTAGKSITTSPPKATTDRATYNFKLIRNLALSLAAGNATIWKPSPTTPLCALAVTGIISRVLEANNIPGAVASLVTGGKEAGEAVVESPSVELGPYAGIDTFHLRCLTLSSLVSFTGSERVGRIVGQAVASRFGKVILELGGNNGMCTRLHHFMTPPD